MPASVGARSTNQEYANGDQVRQKFTGYLKDNETGLDFAEARMYENRHGRFTAVDPLLASGKSANPQTFNRYTFVGNSPLVRTDPNGKDWIVQVTQTKIKEQLVVRGRVRTVERTVEVRTPIWIAPSDAAGIPRVEGIWQVTFGEQKGFQALHPTDNLASPVFASAEEARGWNPSIQVMVYESTLFSGAVGSAFKGVVGHVALGINDKTYSWDNSGYEQSSRDYPLFSDYLAHNATYRTGTLYDLDFGSPSRNSAAAEEIRNGPRNAFSITIFNSGYNMVTNNCGESMCRITDRLGLQRPQAIAPFQYGNYLEENMRNQIRNQRRFGPPPPPPPKRIDPCTKDARYC